MQIFATAPTPILLIITCHYIAISVKVDPFLHSTKTFVIPGLFLGLSLGRNKTPFPMPN